MEFKNRSKIFLGITLLVAVGFILGGIVFKFIVPSAVIVNGINLNLANREINPPEGVDFDPLWRAWQLIEEHYVNRDELDRQKLLEGAIRGLVQSLDDPYSTFLAPEEERDFEESIDGKFEGIGVEIGIRNDVLTVIAPLVGTPAARAGIRAGDSIIKIDDVPTENMNIREAVSRIRGQGGTTVILTILRDNWVEPRNISILRSTIRIPSVTLEYPARDIAVLKIHNFHARVMPEFRGAVRQITENRTRNIILDLRNNPGGFFDYAVEMAGWFLQRDSIVVKTDQGAGPEVCDNCRASGNALFANPNYKIVILVNEGSASAAEILAGALRDNRGIKIIGMPTFGKGSVQELINMNDAGALKLTISRWLTPNGTDISKEAIRPDIIIENPDAEDIVEPEDLQMQRAIEIIRSARII